MAYAARAGSLADMLQVVRSHVLAMPLDYLVVWLFGRVSTQELVLRIPAAIWGSLSLLLAYRIYRQFSNPLPALFGMLILALSPLHIQYSQELRFYASLVFFYLLSTWMLWRAIQQPSHRNWALSAAATVVGIFFHPYVIFSLANGLVWLVQSARKGQAAQMLRVSFLFSATASLLAFLAGYMFFSASNTFQIPLMVFEQSPAGAVATGLGWLPFSPGAPGLSWAWGFLCAALEIAGVVLTIKRGPGSPQAGLFYSLLLQLAAVFGSDLLGHYFFAPRQLLMLLPTLCLFAGIGVQEAIAWIGFRLRGFQPERMQIVLPALAALLLLLASLPAIRAYERDDKGNTRAITQLILQEWKPGDTILVTPGYEGFVYKYYIEYAYGRQDASARLFSADWEDVLKMGNSAGSLFVITPSTLTETETGQLHSLGLAPLYHTNLSSHYAKTLWARERANP